jgi:hypothetical protein
MGYFVQPQNALQCWPGFGFMRRISEPHLGHFGVEVFLEAIVLGLFLSFDLTAFNSRNVESERSSNISHRGCHSPLFFVTVKTSAKRGPVSSDNFLGPTQLSEHSEQLTVTCCLCLLIAAARFQFSQEGQESK